MTNTTYKTRTAARTEATSGIDTAARGTLAVVGGASALIGIWAAACFVGAIVTAGGPVSLVKAYFSAISGM